MKLPSLQLSSANFNAVVPCFRFFLITELKKMWNISFLRDFQIMVFEQEMISNERPFEWYIMWLCSEKKISLHTSYNIITFCIWRHNIFPAFWSIKNWSVHKEQPSNIEFKHNWNKNVCSDRILWSHRYLGNRVFRKIW